mmetsp:Transcript_13304/g.28113  ORF Transcript_13304/g.28113 Transcript_13304/m.28113 type:complete len:213 (+) Transcript_13304:268-906(+)
MLDVRSHCVRIEKTRTQSHRARNHPSGNRRPTLLRPQLHRKTPPHLLLPHPMRSTLPTLQLRLRHPQRRLRNSIPRRMPVRRTLLPTFARTHQSHRHHRHNPTRRRPPPDRTHHPKTGRSPQRNQPKLRTGPPPLRSTVRIAPTGVHPSQSSLQGPSRRRSRVRPPGVDVGGRERMGLASPISMRSPHGRMAALESEGEAFGEEGEAVVESF